jgi:hypothetical protein
MRDQELTKLEGFAFLEYLDIRSARIISYGRSHATHITTTLAWKDIVAFAVLRTTVQVFVND